MTDERPVAFEAENGILRQTETDLLVLLAVIENYCSERA